MTTPRVLPERIRRSLSRSAGTCHAINPSNKALSHLGSTTYKKMDLACLHAKEREGVQKASSYDKAPTKGSIQEQKNKLMDEKQAASQRWHIRYQYDHILSVSRAKGQVPDAMYCLQIHTTLT